MSVGIQQSIAFNTELNARVQFIKEQRNKGAKEVKVQPIRSADYNNSYSIGNVFAELAPNNPKVFPNKTYKSAFRITVDLQEQ